MEFIDHNKIMTRIFDAAQAEALPEADDREAVLAYCNAAINSGLGALERHYKDAEWASGSRACDAPAYVVLKMWLEKIEARIKDREASE